MPEAHDKHGAHGHDDGHGHGLPPPEPDVVPGSVAIWGLLTFALVIGVVLLLGGYFWAERYAEERVKVWDSYESPELQQAKRADEAHLAKVRKLDNGRYQIPIATAMNLVAQGK
jgi:hypothetical protein